MSRTLTSGAQISECGKYRYLLSRTWVPQACGIKGPAVFVMLNPSTADAYVDDPTVRRCRAFATAWGYEGLIVANLYAYRATSPNDLRRVVDPIGPMNDATLRLLAQQHKDIILACGNNASVERLLTVAELLQGEGAQLWDLGETARHMPRHPLYIKGDTLPRWVEYRVRRDTSGAIAGYDHVTQVTK